MHVSVPRPRPLCVYLHAPSLGASGSLRERAPVRRQSPQRRAHISSLVPDLPWRSNLLTPSRVTNMKASHSRTESESLQSMIAHIRSGHAPPPVQLARIAMTHSACATLEDTRETCAPCTRGTRDRRAPGLLRGVVRAGPSVHWCAVVDTTWEEERGERAGEPTRGGSLPRLQLNARRALSQR